MYENLPALEKDNRENEFLHERELILAAVAAIERNMAVFGLFGDGDMNVLRAMAGLALESRGLEYVCAILAESASTNARLKKVADFFREIKRRHDVGEEPEAFIADVVSNRYEYTPDDT